MKENKSRICEVCGATEKESPYIHYSSKADKMLCCKHYTQVYRYGHIMDYSIYDHNNYILHDDYAEVELKSKYGDVTGYALIDIEDVEKCKQYKWYLHGKGYAMAKADKKSILMHKFILDYRGYKEIDHINRNRLDNRKSNLRLVSRSENRVNTVAKNSTGQLCIEETPYHTFRVKIIRDGKPIHNKRYKTLESAVEARDRVISEYNISHNRAC